MNNREWQNGSGYISPTEQKAGKWLDRRTETWTPANEEAVENERKEASALFHYFSAVAERKGFTLITVVAKKKKGTGRKFKLLDNRAKETRR